LLVQTLPSGAARQGPSDQVVHHVFHGPQILQTPGFRSPGTMFGVTAGPGRIAAGGRTTGGPLPRRSTRSPLPGIRRASGALLADAGSGGCPLDGDQCELPLTGPSAAERGLPRTLPERFIPQPGPLREASWARNNCNRTLQPGGGRYNARPGRRARRGLGLAAHRAVDTPRTSRSSGPRTRDQRPLDVGPLAPLPCPTAGGAAGTTSAVRPPATTSSRVLTWPARSAEQYRAMRVTVEGGRNVTDDELPLGLVHGDPWRGPLSCTSSRRVRAKFLPSSR